MAKFPLFIKSKLLLPLLERNIVAERGGVREKLVI